MDIFVIVLIVVLVLWVLLTMATGNPIVAIGWIMLIVLTPVLLFLSFLEPGIFAELLTFSFISSFAGWLLGQCD